MNPPSSPATLSARNEFDTTVLALQPGPVNCELTLALAGGDRLVAVVTQDSVQRLGLAPGAAVRAIVKAPWVMLATGGRQPLARNHWQGTVSAIRPGPVNAEVALTLPGGTVMHAVVTAEAVTALGLAVGAPAQAIVKASQVVLAV